MSAAQMMGLSREDAIELHRLYLSALGRLALEDSVVYPAERADLESVAVALGLSAGAVEASLVPAGQPAMDVCEVGGFALKPGDAVVFTGDAPRVDRTDLEYQARALGVPIVDYATYLGMLDSVSC